MRPFLLVFGWLPVMGSLIVAAITFLLFAFVYRGDAAQMMTVGARIRELLPWLNWTRGVAEAVFPDHFVAWLFGLPALKFFPGQLIVSAFLGGWALKAAGRIARRGG